MNRENIVAIDFETNGEWSFIRELKDITGIDWKLFGIPSNEDRTGIKKNTIRYIKYFLSGAILFLKRNKYENIVSWQQFIGIIYAFLCRLFRVKKNNRLVILTFIFKEKKGLIGNIYYWFVRYAISGKYVDRIVCFASTEPSYYANKFNVDISKFSYIPLSYELNINNVGRKETRKKIVSIGYSNRDFQFLIDVFNELKYPVEIYCDRDESIGPNIVMSSEKVGERIEELLSETRILLIPLENNNISAGQLTALQAMQLGVPIIGTLSEGLRDFVVDQKSGYLVPNKKELWIEKIEKLMIDDSLWIYMSKESTEYFKASHSLKAMTNGIVFILDEINKER